MLWNEIGSKKNNEKRHRGNNHQGKNKVEDDVIPRIAIIPTDLPFDFKRLQFSVRQAFAMTINKLQGQSLELCGIFPVSPMENMSHACALGNHAAILCIAKQNKKHNFSESLTFITICFKRSPTYLYLCTQKIINLFQL